MYVFGLLEKLILTNRKEILKIWHIINRYYKLVDKVNAIEVSFSGEMEDNKC